MLARDSDISESGDEVGIDTALLDMIIARAPGNRKWKLILTPTTQLTRTLAAVLIGARILAGAFAAIAHMVIMAGRTANQGSPLWRWLVFLAATCNLLVSATQALQEVDWRHCSQRGTASATQKRFRACADFFIALVLVGIIIATVAVPPSAKPWVVDLSTLCVLLIEAMLYLHHQRRGRAAQGTGPHEVAGADQTAAAERDAGATDRERYLGWLSAIAALIITVLLLVANDKCTGPELNERAALLLASTLVFAIFAWKTLVQLGFGSGASTPLRRHPLLAATLLAAFAAFILRVTPESQDKPLLASLQFLLMAIVSDAVSRWQVQHSRVDAVAFGVAASVAIASAFVMQAFPAFDVLLVVNAVCLVGPLMHIAKLASRLRLPAN